MNDDAIYVFCNMTAEGETCIYPDIQSASMPNIPWKKDDTDKEWYSTFKDGSKVIISYVI